MVTPARAWTLLAHSVVEPCDLAATPAGVSLTMLQAEGAARAAAIIDRYGGVIVADSVGMGKTYIALRLIEHAVAAQTPVVLVIPATLRTKWRAALRSAGLERAPPVVTLVTHALVHRTLRPADGAALVVVDEAHQFRNPQTARYRALALLCAHARVVLLTATPINNRPADLYWLLRLFVGDGAFYDAGVPDLRAILCERGEATHADLARRVVARVVVRRTRSDLPALRDTGLPHLRFPQRRAPRPVPYELRAACPDLIDGLDDAFALLRLSAFDLSAPSREPTMRAAARRPIAGLIRIGLLKRLESSTEAFRASLMRLLRFLDVFDEAVACGGYLRARDSRTTDPLQFSLTPLLARPLPRTVDRAQLAQDVAADRDVLRRMLHAVPTDGAGTKTVVLAQLLDRLADSPRVVFTEYADTAEALFAALPKDGVALLHGTRAALASGPVSRRTVLERFAPAACGVRPPPHHEHIHTLIATDVLAEGLDLQDARHCISFDLPWNPVRLMQRAGRIDRLGSPHDEVSVWYFEPTAELERLLGLMRRLGAKVRTIERTLGTEHAVVRETHGDVAADRGARAALETLRTLVPVMRAAATDGKTTSGNVRPSPGAVMAARTATGAVDAPTLLLAWRIGESSWVDGVRLAPDATQHLEVADIARLLVALHPARPAARGGATARGAIIDALRAYRAYMAGHACGASSLARRTAATLRWALAQPRGTPDAALCRRADRILRQLRRGLPTGAADSLRDVLRAHAASDARALCTTLEGVLAGRRSHSTRQRKSLVAALLLEPSPDGPASSPAGPSHPAIASC